MQTPATAVTLGLLGSCQRPDTLLNASTAMAARGISVIVVLGTPGHYRTADDWAATVATISTQLAQRRQSLFFTDATGLALPALGGEGIAWVQIMGYLPPGWRSGYVGTPASLTDRPTPTIASTPVRVLLGCEAQPPFIHPDLPTSDSEDDADPGGPVPSPLATEHALHGLGSELYVASTRYDWADFSATLRAPGTSRGTRIVLLPTETLHRRPGAAILNVRTLEVQLTSLEF